MAPAAFDPDRPIRTSHWLLVGGRGAPPTATGLVRMALERNAVEQEVKAYEEDRRKAQAEFEERWGRDGLLGLLDKVTGRNKRKKLGRDELMRLYGPQGSRRTDGGRRD